MNVSLYIAQRYLRSKSSNNAINIISIIAIIGIILGAASLFIVLSGFAGLKDFTLQFSTIVDPDLKAETATGKSFVITGEELNKLNDLDDVAVFSKVIEERVIVASNDKNYFATIKGVDANFKNVVAIDSIISQGSWLDQKTNQIVVGWGISNNLSFGVLDYAKAINLYVPKPGRGQITSAKNAFKTVNAINVGVFDINENLNDTYVFASIDLAQNLLNYKPNQVSSIEFKLSNGADEIEAKQNIQAILGDKVVIKNRAQLNDALYKMLNSENLAVYLIFTLVLIIALFNVIGSIIMMILDKKKSLNTLFNLGATIKDIRKIFFFQGALMSVLGGLVGLGLALIVLVLQNMFDLVMITPSLAYPVTIKTKNFFIVLITISVLGILASKIASARITKSLVQAQ
ncbi:ABC transporter permease [Sabulilitoribacter arenilitoris]|uniref:ABC transporter permease n=1 Tax=Wocania arenilitoris TaxID=2044858 RepID=A0AAE3JLY7_9FLAO|nr:FtsX-like permease family protein [Wocania arenilitoris]MCF7568747.1 ABC transporter permease [Wocania arenilitoris]